MSNLVMVDDVHDHPHHEPQQTNRIIVAVAATMSLIATGCLLIYVMILHILIYWPISLQPSSSSTSSSLLASRSQNHHQFHDHRLMNKNRVIQKDRWLSIQIWARHKLAFIRTPFGIMFINLVLADFIQAIGFGMNYVWVTHSHLSCHSSTCQNLCTLQGVLIQLGDLASAFSNLMIAIQTFVILTFSWHLPNWVTWFSISMIWIPVFVLSFLAPTVMGNWRGPEPFYTWAGDWCWISQVYSPLRLFLHYLWIFVCAFGSIGLYGHLFLRLQIHFKKAKSIIQNPTTTTATTTTNHPHHLGSPTSISIYPNQIKQPIEIDHPLSTSAFNHHQPSSPSMMGIKDRVWKIFSHQQPSQVETSTVGRVGGIGRGRSFQEQQQQQQHELPFHRRNHPLIDHHGPLNCQADHLRKKLERKARAMIMYPIAFIFLILPLSTFRLAALAGHDWGITAATVCGSMYCLSGFIDVLLFGTTRSIISVPVFSFQTHHPSSSSSITSHLNDSNRNGILEGSSRRKPNEAFRVEVIRETVVALDDDDEDDGLHSGMMIRSNSLDDDHLGTLGGGGGRVMMRTSEVFRNGQQGVLLGSNHRGLEQKLPATHPTPW